MDATATVLLGTIGVGFGGLAWRMFSQLDSLQDPRNAGSFEKRLDELFADFQVLSMTPRIWSVFQRALQFPLQNQSEFFAQPEAQLEFNRIRARLEQLVLVNRSAHSAMESLSSAGAISAAGAFPCFLRTRSLLCPGTRTALTGAWLDLDFGESPLLLNFLCVNT